MFQLADRFKATGSVVDLSSASKASGSVVIRFAVPASQEDWAQAAPYVSGGVWITKTAKRHEIHEKRLPFSCLSRFFGGFRDPNVVTTMAIIIPLDPPVTTWIVRQPLSCYNTSGSALET